MTEQVSKDNKQKEVVGVVVSNKMTKTIVVQVARRVRHPLYHKVMTRHKKFHAHDENGEANMGDKVRIVSSRPLSRLKRWTLAEVITKAELIDRVKS